MREARTGTAELKAADSKYSKISLAAGKSKHGLFSHFCIQIKADGHNSYFWAGSYFGAPIQRDGHRQAASVQVVAHTLVSFEMG